MSNFSRSEFISMSVCVLEAILERFSSLRDMENRTGVYVCVASDGVPDITLRVGDVPDTLKRQKYHNLSEEKAVRLHNRRQVGHTTSRQSADENQSRYPGAIVGGQRIYSISGLPADLDELGSTVIAFLMGDLTADEAQERLYRNPHQDSMRAVIDRAESLRDGPGYKP